MARPKKPETPIDPLVSVRNLYYEFLKHLDTTSVNLKAAAELIEQVNKHKNAEKLWAGLAAYRDLRGEKTMLMHAVHSKCRPLYDALIKAGADINCVDKSGRAVGHYAASGDNDWFIKLAVEELPSSNLLYLQDDYGQRPIDLATSLNNRDFIREFELADKVVSKRTEQLVEALTSAVSKYGQRDAAAALQYVLRGIK